MINTNQNPYLSVIIPVYNEQSRITYTLEKLTSFLNEQTFKWQILIINDGSTDNTENIVEEWMQKDPRILIESIPHQGKGIAIKTGMLSSSGSYRFMCDADLAMPINELSKFLDAAEKNYDIVIVSSPPLFTGIIGVFLQKYKSIPFWLDIRDLWPDSAFALNQINKNFFYYIGKKIESTIYNSSKGFIFPVPGFKQYLNNGFGFFD